MGMTPYRFYSEFVVQNAQDFYNNPGSVRCAFNAAVAASHMLDHFVNYQGADAPMACFETKDKLIEHLRDQTQNRFKLVRNVADAYKHLYINRYDPDLTSAGAVYSIEITDDQGQVGEIIAELNEEDNPTEAVRVRTTDGHEVNFTDVLNTVVQCWERLLPAGDEED